MAWKRSGTRLVAMPLPRLPAPTEDQNMKFSCRIPVLACAVTAVLAACTTTPRRVDELDAARAAIQQVQATPDAGRFAAAEVAAANEALREADRLMEQDKSAAEVRQAAYLAQRHADIAAQLIARGQAERKTSEAEAERQRVLAQAREQEAAAAQALAEQARKQAEQAAQAAQREAEMLQSQIAELQARPTDRGLVLTLGDVLFDTGQAALKPGAMGTIDRLANFLRESPGRSVVIEGHTDSTGSDALNLTLSESRASGVKAALMQRGVDAQRVVAVGKGKSAPIASNDTAAGRQQNRRVEIIISNPQDVSAGNAR
ncbi:MAG: OmpA family protein [Pseudomonadota bacterium]|nr:OmpA family protein [Pseudomonadota bacterium]